MPKKLADYPRPKADTGLGVHLSANAHNTRYRDANLRARDIDLWNQMGIKWLKSLTDGDSQLVAVKELVKAGLEVIVRFYKPPLTTDVPPADLMKQFADVGVRYVESYINEPEIEWGRPPVPEVIDLLADAHIRFADTCAHVGLIPCTPAIQGDRLNSWFMPMCQRIIARGRKDALEGSVVAGHWRPGDYWRGNSIYAPDSEPRMPDGNPGFVFRSYEMWDDAIRQLLGHPLPLLGTEAGREPPEVRRDLQLHASDNVALAQMKWREALFCQCYWLWSDGSAWSDSTWVDNLTYGPQLPVVDAFRAMPKPQRSGAVEPEEPEKPVVVTTISAAVADALRQKVHKRMADHPWGIKVAWSRGYIPFGDEVSVTIENARWYAQPARRPDGNLCLLVFQEGHYTLQETKEVAYTMDVRALPPVKAVRRVRTRPTKPSPTQ